VRALLDGITGVVVRDDALVVRVDAEKVYADDVYPPGVSVEVLSR
jgi:Holliday junction resolvase RusA-like endonuclease